MVRLAACVLLAGTALAADLTNPHATYQAPMTQHIRDYSNVEASITEDEAGNEIAVYSTGAQFVIRDDGNVYQMGKYPYLTGWAGTLVDSAKACQSACLKHKECKYGTYVTEDADAASHNYKKTSMKGECWLSAHTHKSRVECGVPCAAFDKMAVPTIADGSSAKGFRKSIENKYDVNTPKVCTKDVRTCWEGTQLSRVSQAECEKAYPAGHPRHSECTKHACSFGKCFTPPGTDNEKAQAKEMTKGDDVFLKGAYLEVGVAQKAYYGTHTSTLPAFVSFKLFDNSWSLPGSPHDSWMIGYYKGTTKHVQCVRRNGGKLCKNNFKCSKVGHYVHKGVLNAKTMCENEDVRVHHVLEFQSKDLFMRTNVVVESKVAGIKNVRYMRALDPSKDGANVGRSKKHNLVLGQQENGDSFTAVRAASAGADKTDAWIALYSADKRAFAKFANFNHDPYVTISDAFMKNPDKRGSHKYADAAINIAFDIGDIDRGTRDSFHFYHVMDKRFEATSFHGMTDGGAPKCVWGCPACTCDPSVHPSHFNECHRDPWSLHIVVTHLAPRFHARPFEKDSQHRCMMVGKNDKENKCACCTCSAKNQPSLMPYGMRDLGFKAHPKAVGSPKYFSASTLGACAKQCSITNACKWGSFVERNDGSTACLYFDNEPAVDPSTKKMIVEDCPDDTVCHSFLRGITAAVKHEKINLKQKYGQGSRVHPDGRRYPHGDADQYLKIAEADKNKGYHKDVANSVM